MSNIPYDSVIDKLKGQRVMLVGGAGFIGHNMSLELRRNGIETMVADNMVVNSMVDNAYHDRGDPTKRKLNIHFLMDRFDMMRDAGVEMRNVDARLFSDLAQVFDEFKPTKVVHLSAISSAVEARKNPGLCFDLQLTTLRNVLELCRLNHDQVDNVMFLSSSTVYGDFETPTVDETTRPRPRGIYANAKYMGERLLRTYCHQHGLGVSIVRPSALYGERCVSRRVSQAFIENALAGKTLYLDGGGDGRLDFTYIDDLVEGMVRTVGLFGGREVSATFNLTFGNARTIGELAEIVKEFVPDVNLEIRDRSNDRPIRGTLSMDRANEMLGFHPKWPLEKGYRQYCEWYIGEWEKVVGSRK
ncbi:MAG: NAD(P)-dependent oxidoreductase [Rhodospirillaceae bacterium]|jgi:nucleoside-diphosphate-sugar epimerase|nr:NAD(P)-dependent oxidoreductase [Rhodospirillaceae bacterium]MBT6136060.1 NAD(P)-dependent oxidoreductase [Rhodospirillaceae bacterium]